MRETVKGKRKKMNWNKVEIDVCKPRRGDIMRNRMQAKRSLRQQQAVERSPEGATSCITVCKRSAAYGNSKQLSEAPKGRHYA